MMVSQGQTSPVELSSLGLCRRGGWKEIVTYMVYLAYISLFISMVELNVSKYTSPMDRMGIDTSNIK